MIVKRQGLYALQPYQKPGERQRLLSERATDRHRLLPLYQSSNYHLVDLIRLQLDRREAELSVEPPSRWKHCSLISLYQVHLEAEGRSAKGLQSRLVSLTPLCLVHLEAESHARAPSLKR
jgi:hypothetical protein